MKTKFIFIVLLIIISIVSKAQSVTLTPNGVWIPSMTTTARTNLTATDGQLVYDTDTKSFWYFNSTTWKELNSEVITNFWSQTGSNISTNVSGNVGIGTSAPINKLDVAGAVVIGSGFAGTVPVPANGATIQGQVGIGSGPSNTESNLTIGPNSVIEGGQIQLNPGTRLSNAFYIDNWADNFRIMSGTNYVSETPRFLINSVGNIGIGTTYPTEKFEVSGKTKTTNFQMTNGASNGSILQSDANGNATWVASSTITDNLGNHLATTNLQMGNNYINNDGGSEGLSINTNGAVTIQPSVSTDPSLTISTSNTPAYRIAQIANGIYPAYQWDMGGNETLFFLKDVSAGSKLPFRVYAGQNTDRLVLRNNNVGIGVNSPSEALEVSGKTKTTNFQITNGATNGYVLQSDADGNASWVAPTVLPNANWTINGSNQYSALAGNVGIGTTLPTEKLMVEGNINIKNGRLAFQNDYSSILIGGSAGLSNAADYNVFIGNNAGRDNTTGEYNTFIGNFAGKANISAFHNTALGFGALENNTSGSFNTALGFYSLNKNATGKENVATGYDALENNTTANHNTANGYYALKTNTTGNGNAAFGYRSLQNNISANFNASFGYQALKHNTDGEENTAMGTLALESNTTGDYNVAVGMNALTQNTTGSQNQALGYEAGYGNVEGDDNLYLGHQAGYFNSLGSKNVFIGYQAGYNETGSNKLYIANSETPLIYGDFVNKNIGIGTSTLPAESNLVIAGNGNGEGGQIQLNASTGQSTAYFLDNYNNAFRIMSGTNEGSSSVRFMINSSGNIGIGTITPSGKLDVTGSGVINSNVRSTDNIASITVESPNQNDATLFFNRYDGTNSLKRWAWIKANSNETGSNAGGDFVLNRYSDAGTYMGQPILVYRNSGAVVIGNEGTSTTENTFRVNGSIAVKRTVYTANATIAGNDHLIGVTSTGSVTLTLPSATGIVGREYIIKSEASSASITITTTASQKIDGASSKSITSGYGVLRVYSDGSNWFTF